MTALLIRRARGRTGSASWPRRYVVGFPPGASSLVTDPAEHAAGPPVRLHRHHVAPAELPRDGLPHRRTQTDELEVEAELVGCREECGAVDEQRGVVQPPRRPAGQPLQEVHV